MNTILNMVKAAHQNGEPLFKGDVVGHEFHGNQYAAAAAKAQVASDNARKTGRAQDHVRAATLHWNAARLAQSDSQIKEHSLIARKHDMEANRP